MVVSDFESNQRVIMASKYLSRMLRNRSLCSQCSLPLNKDKVHSSHGIGELKCDVTAAISVFDKRFSLQFSDIAEKVTTGDSRFHLLFFLLYLSYRPS
jgi:hypothetical protein